MKSFTIAFFIALLVIILAAIVDNYKKEIFTDSTPIGDIIGNVYE